MPKSESNKPANDPYCLKKTPIQARARATVDAILDAAAQILVEQSFGDASTNRIAERAGVSIGSLYEYFPGKLAIFSELHRREGLKWYGELVSDPPTEPRDALRYLVERRIRYCRDNLALYTAMATEVPVMHENRDGIFDDFKAMSVEFFESHGDEIRPAVDIGFLSEFLMRTVTAMIHGFAIHAPHWLEDPQVTEEVISMLGRYLLISDKQAT